MAKKTSKRPDPFVSQANALTTVRYGPEISALTALMRQAQDTYGQSVRGAKSTAQLIQSSVDRAAPGVGQAYDKSVAQAQAAQSVAAPSIAALPAGSPFAAVAGIEQAGLTGRLAEQKANTLAELAQRRVAAGEGSQWAQQAARRQLSTDTGRIGQRLSDLGNEQGAFMASTITDLAGSDAAARASAAKAQATLTQQERNSIRSAGMNPDAPLKDGGYAPTPGGKLDPKAKAAKAAGKRWASNAAQSKASDQIQGALNEANTLKSTGAARHEAAQLLLEGAPDVSQPVYRTVTKGGKTTQERVLNADGTQKTKTIPGIPKVESQLLLSAALDMAYDGHLSSRNQKLLHDRGIKLAPLGLVTYGDWLKKRATSAIIQRPGNAPGVGGSRPT